MSKLLFIVALVACALAAEQFVSMDLSQEKGVDAFWTKERMLSAKPMDLIISDEVVAIKGEIQFAAFNGTRENPTPNKYPYATAGRLFFSTGSGQSSCTASSVGNDIILTAGHCVSSGRGRYYTQFSFCPQHKDGACPEGRFTGAKVVTFARWHNGADLGRDVAFVKVSAGLESKVGSVEVAVNLPRTQTCDALGYPGNIGGGRRMIISSGIQSMGHTTRNPPTVKFPSRMTYGSSGGPWIIKSADAKRKVNGNVSYGNPTADPNNFYGPYFDTEVANLLKTV
jgi:V8-like Glu-specific endopeptidase